MREEDVTDSAHASLPCNDRRGHLCLGGSSLADPLVLECVEGRTDVGSNALALGSLGQGSQRPNGDLGLRDAETADLAAGSIGAHPASPEPPVDLGRFSVRGTSERLLRDARLLSITHLTKGNLRPLREAIAGTSEQDDPQSWAAFHVILGCALRLRSRQMRGPRRATALAEAIHAFDVAFSVYAGLAEAPLTSFAQTQLQDGHRELREPCRGLPDGAALIAKVLASTPARQTVLLERAVVLLRQARTESSDRRSWDWISSTNNLACALTLLAHRSEHTVACALLDEAAQALHEVLNSQAAQVRDDDRRCTLANLAEVLTSMAARETPALRLRHLEGALQASAEALAAVVPPAYAWLVQFEQLNLF